MNIQIILFLFFMVVSSHARGKNVNEIRHRKSKYLLIKLKDEKIEKADSDSPILRGKFYQKKTIFIMTSSKTF